MQEKTYQFNVPLLIVRIIIVLMAISFLVIGGLILYKSIIATEYEASKLWIGAIIAIIGFSSTSYNLVKLANMGTYQSRPWLSDIM